MAHPVPGRPLVWSPQGVSDSLDASTSFPGSMSALTDLIPDPTTRNLWQCRPAAVKLVSFTNFVNPGFISTAIVVGNYVYGMCAGGTNGNDIPFGYDILGNAMLNFTGISDPGNVPTSPLTAGDWNPPSMALVGTKIIVAHPGFNGSTNGYFGFIDISTPTSPKWNPPSGTTAFPGNTAPVALAYPPQWVAAFNGRCYYLVNPPGQQPAAYFSDLQGATAFGYSDATTIAKPDQILTFGDNTALTCAYGLPLNNQLGGIIQSLMIFKGVTNIHQVTGDYALSNLAVNSLNVATGTLSPLSVAPSSKGLFFLAPDGLRLIDFNANVSDPIGNDGSGINLPFQYSITPSRANAMYNSGVYRVQIKNPNISKLPPPLFPEVFDMFNAGLHIAFANSNTTVSNPIASFWSSVRATLSQPSDKFYCEFTILGAATNNVAIGVSNDQYVPSDNSYPGIDANSISLTYGGYWYYNGTSSNSYPSFTVGNTVQMAVDVSARLVWWRVNGTGNWNAGGSADPNTGVGGLSIPFGGPLYPTIALRGAAVTANFGATPYTFTPPVGYGSWGGPPLDPQQQQWWFDITRGIWSGPHTIATSLMLRYNNTFFAFLQGSNGAIWQSDVLQGIGSIFNENGRPLAWVFGTSYLPDYEAMSVFQCVEATLLTQSEQNPITVAALDANAATLDTVVIPPGGTTSVWGGGTGPPPSNVLIWNVGYWDGQQSLLQPRRLPWHFPLVFNRVLIVATAPSMFGVKVGRLFMRYRDLGYLLQDLRAS